MCVSYFANIVESSANSSSSIVNIHWADVMEISLLCFLKENETNKVKTLCCDDEIESVCTFVKK